MRYEAEEVDDAVFSDISVLTSGDAGTPTISTSGSAPATFDWTPAVVAGEADFTATDIKLAPPVIHTDALSTTATSVSYDMLEKPKEKAAKPMAEPAAPAAPSAPTASKKDLPPTPPPPTEKAGTLTAGEIHDFSKWDLWEDIADTDLNAWQGYWGITPQNRFSVQLINEQGWPLVDKEVELRDQSGTTIWTARTDNTGKAELWSGIYGLDEATSHTLTATVNGQKYPLETANMFHAGVNTRTIPVACGAPNLLDVMFVVDATGSMGDEINYLKAELEDVINRVKANDAELEVNLGSVFYRDHG